MVVWIVLAAIGGIVIGFIGGYLWAAEQWARLLADHDWERRHLSSCNCGWIPPTMDTPHPPPGAQ